MDVGFIVLCPDRNTASLKNTVGSVGHHTTGRECIAVVPKITTPKEMKEFKNICDTYKGQDTITSLVNIGMKRLKHEWGCLLFGGSRIFQYTERRFKNFIRSERDVIYPIVEQKLGFVDASFNGLVINKGFFEEVGDFPTAAMQKEGLNDFEFAKLLWALDAIEKRAQFKGIVGLRII
jgi:hypothetical protein